MDSTKTVVELSKLEKFTSERFVSIVQQLLIVVEDIFECLMCLWLMNIPKEQFSTLSTPLNSTREHTSHVSWCGPIGLVRTSRRDERRWVDWSFATYMHMFTNYTFKLFLSWLGFPSNGANKKYKGQTLNISFFTTVFTTGINSDSVHLKRIMF